MSKHDFPTLLHSLEYWAKTTPNRVYFTQPISATEQVTYTWAQVFDQVKRMTAHIQSLNLPPHSNISIIGKNSAHWIMADLAVWMSGHVSAPIYPTVNAETCAYVLEHCEAKVLFVGKMDELWKVAKDGVPQDGSIHLIALPLAPEIKGEKWDDILAKTEPTKAPVVRTPDELATIMYTSGSTGNPKGVMIPFRSMTAALNGIAEAFDTNENDRMLSYLPLAHAAERAIVETGSLYYGFSIFFAYSLDTFVEDLRRANPTVFFSVPRLWTKFYTGICKKIPPHIQKILFSIPILSGLFKKFILKKLGLANVRLALSGSAPLAPSLIQWYRDLGLELLEGYAMTENFAYSHGGRLQDTRVGYVGQPYPGVECKIAENGEVLVKSPGSMLGYYKNPELTAEAFTEDGFLKTGDMGVTDEKGRLKITGRVKELFKTSKGKYVAPVPIENRLGGHALIEAVCVTGPSFTQPFGLLMLSLEGHQLIESDPAAAQRVTQELEELLTSVNAQLEAHEVLSCLIVVKDMWTMENGFLTPTMKIKRNIIEAHYLPKAEAWVKSKKAVIVEA
ncbi:MAG: AMP-binding protein [Limnobacter sp.]|nr:AMP-binding protein [Limnobacter sp.]